MSRFSPYLGVVAAVILGAFVIAFSGSVTPSPTPPIAPTASSTLSVLPGLARPSASPTFDSKTKTKKSTVATSSGHAPSVPAHKKTAGTAVPTSPSPATEPVSVAAQLPSADPAALNNSASLLRRALVNIICYAPAGSSLHSISGSGVFIDPKGIILTNAHIAQYFLLANRGVSCVVRSGSPATNHYAASLIFLSSPWVRANAGVLTEATPSGTGEYDFALLAVSKSVTSDALPATFPSLPLATTPPSTLTPVVIASYGAQFLDPSQVQSTLFPTIVFGSVKEVFTFGVNTIDVLALGGSAAAQEGSSGGGVADASGTLVGTITTSTVEGATATRSLNAITASYIRAEYASETGQALDLLLAESTSTSIANFAPKIPALESVLTAPLP